MSGEPRVLADRSTGAVYVAWGDGGPVYRLTPGGGVTEQFREPVPLTPLLTEDGAAEWAVEKLCGVRLSKTARTAVAKAFGVEPDELV